MNRSELVRSLKLKYQTIQSIPNKFDLQSYNHDDVGVLYKFVIVFNFYFGI